MNASVLERLRKASIVPIINFSSLGANLDAIDAVVEGGASVVEVVLRSDYAPKTIEEAVRRHPSVLFAAGTVIDERAYQLARDCGASIAISPGLTPDLARSRTEFLPLVPGAATASEVMSARNEGFSVLKFFPSEAANGRGVIRELSPVLPDVSYFPTGRISERLLSDYAQLKTVICVGGTWMFERTNGQVDAKATVKNMSNALKMWSKARHGQGTEK